MEIRIQELTVGQRIHCILYGGKDGAIYNIVGTQSPESCKSVMNGVGVAGGKARFDIVWDNGTQSQAVPESLIRGSCQWRILDQVDSPEKVAGALAHLALEDAKRNAERIEAENAFKAETERLKEEYPLLEQVGDKNGATLVASNLRKLLKAGYPGVKFSVRKSDYSCVRVNWTDGPTSWEVAPIIKQFSAGRFDGMSDCYEYEARPFSELFGSVNYLFDERKFSEVVIAKAIDTLWALIPGNLKAIVKPTPADALNDRQVVDGFEGSVSEMLRTLMSYYNAIKGCYVMPEDGYTRGQFGFLVKMAINAQECS